MTSPMEVLEFWFQGDRASFRQAWFVADAAFDAACAQFAATLEDAASGACDSWAETPSGALALCIVLDQFPRNLFRKRPEAFACDPKARAVAREAVLARRLDLALTATERMFVYLPFEHSETMADQNLSVALFEGLRDDPDHARPEGAIDYAWRHWHVIRRFGRFPHRNAILGRPSTPAEVTYLSRPGAGF